MLASNRVECRPERFQMQAATFSSHNAAKSRKYYTAFAQSLMSEQPLKKPVAVFTSLNEAVAARDRLLQS